ncbi:solute carrier family 22 member 15-like [Stylophora pistillata]|uniref:solute carrier family 22 member 15-like n=1 Tax=Stylophora pistillata TaxID=50429 RepID=UPI000C0464D8|nr:solute carrier family 22 member 15-like [Stylophora pistillata]
MIWAKFWISISFNGIYLYSSELFPTVLRNTGLSTSSGCGRIDSILCTYILFLERINPLLPYGIMGVVALASALLCTLLPETRFKTTLENTDQTIEHGSFTDEIKKDDRKRISANDEKSPLLSRIQC